MIPEQSRVVFVLGRAKLAHIWGLMIELGKSLRSGFVFKEPQRNLKASFPWKFWVNKAFCLKQGLQAKLASAGHKFCEKYEHYSGKSMQN